MKYRRPIEIRLLEKVKISPESGCFEWGGYKDKDGYGIINVRGKNKKAHRLAYLEEYGIIDKDLLVIHTCDNRCCVNPNHLIQGTHNDNVQDMMKKGRHVSGGKPHLGDKNGMSKLKERDVLFIRSIKGKKTYKEISNLYGVSISCIQNIMLQKSWKHLWGCR